MFKKTMIGMTMLALLLSCSAFAQAYGEGYGYMMGQGGGGYYQASPEQVKAYQEINEKYGKQFAAVQEKMWSGRVQLNGLLAQDKLDRKAIETLAAEVGKLMSEAYKLQVAMSLDMREKGLPYYGMGHGMGPGMMGGHGMGYGMGQGMMGGYGMGPGYYGQGGYGMGYGMGPGMMGGYGMGPGYYGQGGYGQGGYGNMPNRGRGMMQ